MRHAVAEVFNHRGNGGCGVTVFVRGGQFLVRRLFDYCFFIKAVRRRLSAPNRGIVQETSPVNLPPSAVGLGERLRHSIENNRKRIIKPTERTVAAIIAVALFCGWGAVFILHTPATLKLPDENRRNPFLSCRRRHARYA
ncbi:target of rapamycin (TOR) kinase 1 [Trypanosoma cruzi]|nr:target of rapamycin (TOR) kinase 1 [Trypanosoma cruzi]